MYSEKRFFAVPFNQYAGYSVDDYLKLIEPYLVNVDSVFCSAPSAFGDHILPKSLLCNFPNGTCIDNFHGLIQCDEILYDFLARTKGIFKRYITLNYTVFMMADVEWMRMLHSYVFPIIEEFGLDGLILSNYNMACYIHSIYPELEIHNSCNTFSWNIAEIENWRVNAGLTVFNPPRQIVRCPEKLADFHSSGIKLKVLINEACYFGCSEMLNHCILRDASFKYTFNCLKNIPMNILRGCYVTKECYSYLDQYVDVYKLTGKAANLELLKRILDYYILCKDTDNILDVIYGPAVDSFRLQFPDLKINPKLIPDCLFHCECKNCFCGCDVCSKFFVDILKSNA